MKFAQEIEDHFRHGRVYSSLTCAAYLDALKDFEEVTGKDDPALVTPEDFDHYLTRLAVAGRAPATRRWRLYALKSSFRFLKSRGYIAEDPSLDIQGPKVRDTKVPTWTQEEMERLIFAVEYPPVVQGAREPEFMFARRRRVAAVRPLRDAALFALGYSLGLRVDEFRTLLVDHLEEGPGGRLVVRLEFAKGVSVIVHREVEKRAAELIRQYLAARYKAGFRHPALFCALSTTGSAMRKAELPIGIDPRQIGRIIVDRCALAGIEPKGRKFRAHMFRYTLATHLHENGVPIESIQKEMRHRSIATTIAYIRFASSAAIHRGAMNKLAYTRRKSPEELG